MWIVYFPKERKYICDPSIPVQRRQENRRSLSGFSTSLLHHVTASALVLISYLFKKSCLQSFVFYNVSGRSIMVLSFIGLLFVFLCIYIDYASYHLLTKFSQRPNLYIYVTSLQLSLLAKLTPSLVTLVRASTSSSYK